jgi:hypothetical protein
MRRAAREERRERYQRRFTISNGSGRLCSLTSLSVCQNADFYFAQDHNSDILGTTALAA